MPKPSSRRHIVAAEIKAKYAQSTTITRIRARTVKPIPPVKNDDSSKASGTSKDPKAWNFGATKNKMEKSEISDAELRRRFKDRINRKSTFAELTPEEKNRLKKRKQSLKEKGIEVELRDMYIEEAAVEELN
jgi:hypothetical protein